METFQGEKLGLECNATLNRKPVQLQDHGRDMVSFRSNQYDTRTNMLNSM